jgi:hypothetical protein
MTRPWEIREDLASLTSDSGIIAWLSTLAQNVAGLSKEVKSLRTRRHGGEKPLCWAWPGRADIGHWSLAYARSATSAFRRIRSEKADASKLPPGGLSKEEMKKRQEETRNRPAAEMNQAYADEGRRASAVKPRRAQAPGGPQASATSTRRMARTIRSVPISKGDRARRVAASDASGAAKRRTTSRPRRRHLVRTSSIKVDRRPPSQETPRRASRRRKRTSARRRRCAPRPGRPTTKPSREMAGLSQGATRRGRHKGLKPVKNREAAQAEAVYAARKA